MWRISKIQRENNIFLEEIDDYLFAEAIEIKNNKIIFTKEMQNEFITENITRFSDITASIQDLLKLQHTTVILIDSTTEEVKEVTIEIEGGI